MENKIGIIISMLVVGFIFGYLFNEIQPRTRVIEYVEVEVPVVEYKVITEYIEVEVPAGVAVYALPSRTLIKFYDKTIGSYQVYEKTYGDCEIVHETIFYQTENHYWVQKYGGCDSEGEYADHYFLLIDRVYMPIEKAIEGGYITFEEFNQANLGTKKEK
ncbi:hypothetical protein RJG79_09155 [Mycoplasmatota bacterium WC44]